MSDLIEYLEKMVAEGGSDMYLAVGVTPRINVQGRMTALRKEQLSQGECRDLIRQVLSEKQWNELHETREINIAYTLKSMARFRVNAYFQRGTVAAVIRLIRMTIPNFTDLHLPQGLSELIQSKNGLLLVTGATSSGKSTTMATMINHRAKVMSGHIVTIEDPIEYMFDHSQSVVTQREVGLDTKSFEVALKNTLRQAPDVIYIGELRNAETVEFALHSAETGHLVLATLHTTTVPQTIERIVNFFPREYMNNIMMELSYNLKAIISQRLIPNKSGGRLPILEILVNNGLVQELIQKGELGQLKKVMHDGNNEGMLTFDQSLFDLVREGLVTENEALNYADNPSDLERRFS